MKVIVSVLSLALALLIIRFVTYFQAVPQYSNGDYLKLQVVLQEDPVLSNRGQRFTVKTPNNQRISIQTSLNKLYHYGDSLAIDGQLQAKKLTNGREVFLMNYPKISTQDTLVNPLFEASSYIRLKSTVLFEAVLPPVAANLLAGIVFGAKGDFPDSFTKDLQSTGVLHVIAASGMNVSFFTGAVMLSLGSFLKRRIAILLSIFAVVFYSFLVGFQASILRASFMAIIALTASFLGRQDLALFSLFLTGAAMLFVSPSFLFDVGFQLSFMATLGILLVNPRLIWFEKLGAFGEDVKTTLSAQIMTLPILLSTFGSVGTLGILVNVLILWTIPILMVLGSVGVVAGLIFAPFGKAVLFLSLPFLLFFEKVVTFFGGFQLNFMMDSFPWELGVGYYLLLGAIILVTKNRKTQNANLKSTTQSSNLI